MCSGVLPPQQPASATIHTVFLRLTQKRNARTLDVLSATRGLVIKTTNGLVWFDGCLCGSTATIPDENLSHVTEAEMFTDEVMLN